jgi:hypothetical protein
MSAKEADMNALDAWRSRPLTVRTLVRCDGCETLKTDVEKRSNYWPHVRETMCCGECFKTLIAEAQGLIAC